MTELPITERQGGCGCGCSHDELPTLDARAIPGPLRHGAILGALTSLGRGGSMGLIAPHNPLPLLEQIREMHGDAFELRYLSEDPWTLKFTRIR